MPTGVYKHNPHSEKTKEKIRQANLGKHQSNEVREKLRLINKGKGHSPNTEFKKGNIPWNKGKTYGVESRLKMSLAHKNMSVETRIKLSKAKLGGKLPEETKRKMSKAHKGKKRSDEHQQKLNETQRGEKSHFWKGGITPIHKLIRESQKYKLWREAVFKRDNYQCIWGGKEHGSNLHADHIKPFSLFPELRFAVDNGRTLCESCHKTTETYGGKNTMNITGQRLKVDQIVKKYVK